MDNKTVSVSESHPIKRTLYHISSGHVRHTLMTSTKKPPGKRILHFS